MTGPKHSCGVVGISADYDVAPSLYTALMIIQHRGQESAGISVFNGASIDTLKGNGLVNLALPKGTGWSTWPSPRRMFRPRSATSGSATSVIPRPVPRA